MITNNLKTNRIIQPAAYIAFFCLSVFYFCFFADYIFFYQEKSMLFQTSPDYLVEHLSQPGGFLVWLGELQTAFYYYPLVGALMVASEICLVIYLMTQIGRKVTTKTQFFIPFLTGAILFYLQTNYQFQTFNLLGILLQVFVFNLIVSFVKGKSGWVLFLFFSVWYFLTGSFSFILMMMLLLHLFFSDEKYRWPKMAILILPTILFILISKELLFFESAVKLLFYPYANQNIGNQQYLFFTAVVFIAFFPVLFKIRIARTQNLAIRKISVLQFTPFLIILVFGAITISRYDAKDQHYFEVEKLFYKQKFDEVIAYNEQHPSVNILTGFLNNIALAETGKLTDKLFSFPQSPDARTLFLPWELVGEVLKRGGYFYYSIGQINEAQRWAYEYMVMRGNTPEGLKMLIKTELINGNYRVAAKYISILKQSVFYRDEARRFESFIDNETAVLNDAELGGKQRLKTKQDFFVLAENPQTNIDLILAADSTNRIAVQYKFALLLLQKDFENVTRLLPLLKTAGFEKIPKNIEEAVVAYSLLNLGKYPEFEGFTVQPETVISFNRYYQIFKQNSNNKEQAEKALQEYRDTYWYHVFFR